MNDSFAGTFSEKVTRTVRQFSPHLAAKMRPPLTPVIRGRPSAKRAIYICGRPRWFFVMIFSFVSFTLWYVSCGLMTVLWALAIGLLATILHASFRTPNLKARLNTFREEFRAVWRNYRIISSFRGLHCSLYSGVLAVSVATKPFSDWTGNSQAKAANVYISPTCHLLVDGKLNSTCCQTGMARAIIIIAVLCSMFASCVLLLLVGSRLNSTCGDGEGDGGGGNDGDDDNGGDDIECDGLDGTPNTGGGGGGCDFGGGGVGGGGGGCDFGRGGGCDFGGGGGCGGGGGGGGC
ncbi:hypothetical protein H0E87_013058 [Populus deltoides]|uniref:PRA1 family protein n=1 Tax=Populus deltoides TaxID=3696 RepID=A0A8T2YLW5_POPDE|nr:hypothetical protein H0E87_013058 [Populus deltoides]KAH8506077.1 hypothetical protein H0E87_013058 [Populus deltoides]